MKTTINFIALGLSSLIIFNSCKKENNPGTAAPKKLARIEDMSGALVAEFKYDGAGRLLENKNASFTRKFDNSSSLYLCDIFNTANIRTYQIAATGTSNGKVSSVDYKSFKPDGSLNYNEVNNFLYDADGLPISYSYGTYIYTKEFTGGNLTKVNGTKSGMFHSKFEMEYFTDKPAKLELNWFESRFLGDFLTDREQFGAKNKNLIKKCTYTNSSGYTDYSDFSYTFDTEGYVSTCTQIYTEPGASPVTYTYRFIYQ